MKHVVEKTQDGTMKPADREMAGGPVLALLLLGFALLPALSGCLGMGKNDDAKYVTSRQASLCASGEGGGVEAFKETLYPVLRANCTGCHGQALRPFASPDMQSAYKEAIKYADLFSVPNSRFLQKVKDSHCGGYCTAAGGGPAHMTEALNAWKEKEQGAGGCTDGVDPLAKNITTIELPLPAPLPSYVAASATGGGWALMRWPLDKISKDAFFQVSVQQFMADGYRFKEPRLATPNANLYIKDVKILLNGVYNSVNATYTSVEDFVNANGPVPTNLASPIPYPVLSSDFMIIAQDKGIASDKLSVSIEILKPAAAVSCKFLPLFQSAVLPMMGPAGGPGAGATTFNCYGCHGGGTPPVAGNNATARQLFNMAGTPDQICAKALQRTSKANPANSMFIRGPAYCDNNHPNINGAGTCTPIIATPASVNPWLVWITAEWTGSIGGAGGGSGGGPLIPLTPTYTSININIIQQKCTSCHAGAAPAGMVDLSTFTSLRAAPGVVTVSDPLTGNDANNSLLYTETASGQMPPTGPLSQPEIDAIRTWINTGALNN